jgi:hypothetical protein
MRAVIALLAVSAHALNVPSPTPKRGGVKNSADVRPVANQIETWLAEETAAPSVLRPSARQPAPLTQDLYGQELLALAVSMCIAVGLAPPANAMADTSFDLHTKAVQDLLFAPDAAPVTTALMLAGVVITYTASRELRNMIARPSGAATDTTTPLPKYKDWLAGREMPTLQELTDSCVLMASGPHGSMLHELEPARPRASL